MSRDTIRLPHDAYRLLQTLRAAGHSAYVVGGCVRDSLLGRLPGDWDICTSARPDEMKALFQLQIGNPGSSFAVEIARKIGLPEEVIADASEIVGSE